MSDLEQLRLQERILVQELEVIRSKILLVGLMAERKKAVTSPSSEMSKDELVDLLVEQEKDNSIPCPEMSKIESTPESQAPGKEKSNPVKVECLPKTLNDVQTSEKSQGLNLRPNNGIQKSFKSVVETVTEKSVDMEIQNSTGKYYVVFNGPKSGIYESWTDAEIATKGISCVKHCRYNSLLEARTAADIYSRTFMTAPISLIAKSEKLRPKASKAQVRKVPSATPVADASTSYSMKERDFRYLYQKARVATDVDMVEEKFFTTDKKEVSYYNFIKNANPEFVLEAFQAGLIKTIYPSKNLLEIRLLPAEVKRAIKNFRTKCLKDSEKDIVIKISSTHPRWVLDEQVYSPHHIIHVGVSKGEIYTPSIAKDMDLDPVKLDELAIRSICLYIQKIDKIFGEDKVFINHADESHLVYSSTFKKMNEQDKIVLKAIRRKCEPAHTFGPHHVEICKTKVKSGINNGCQLCGPRPCEDKESSASAHGPPCDNTSGDSNIPPKEGSGKESTLMSTSTN